jgi:hypothetical protein
MAWWPLLRERPSLAFRLNLRPAILVMPTWASYWWRNPAKHTMRLHAMSDIPEPGIRPGRCGREPMQALLMRLQSIGTQFRMFNERPTQGMKGMVRFAEAYIDVRHCSSRCFVQTSVSIFHFISFFAS